MPPLIKTILQDDNILAYDAIKTYLKQFDTIQKEADLVLTVPVPSKTYLDATSDKTILQDDNILAYDAIEKYLKEFDNTFCQCNKCLTTPHQSMNQLSGQNNSQFDINPVANPLQRSKRMISQVDDNLLNLHKNVCEVIFRLMPNLLQLYIHLSY